jgi:hypothetical protein
MTVSLATTPNNALQYPTASNIGTDFATGIADLAGDVDGMWSSGTLAARPAAGTRSRLYYATDTGLFYLDNGSAWLVVQAGVDTGWLQWTAGTNMTTAPSTVTPLQARQQGSRVSVRGSLETTALFGGGSYATTVAATLPTGISNPSVAVEVSLQGTVVGAGSGGQIFPAAALTATGSLLLGTALVLNTGSTPFAPLGGNLATNLIIPVNFSY